MQHYKLHHQLNLTNQLASKFALVVSFAFALLNIFDVGISLLWIIYQVPAK